MGWKNVKEHYGIKHIVHVTEQGLCIGSPYISEIMIIDADGKFVKGDGDFFRNKDLQRYQADINADPARFRDLFAAPDTFNASIVVFTYDRSKIIEKLCEEPGWPNVTHDGQLMYENTFSTDRAKVVRSAKRSALAGIEFHRADIVSLENNLSRIRQRLADSTNNLTTLLTENTADDDAEFFAALSGDAS